MKQESFLLRPKYNKDKKGKIAMNKVRLGIIGLGTMGQKYAEMLVQQKIEQAQLVAICSSTPQKLEKMRKKHGESLRYYEEEEKLFLDSTVDAVLITTPHYSHPQLAQEAINANKHFLCEKPIGVYTKNVVTLDEKIKEHPALSCAIVFNQRTQPIYIKAKELVDQGALGEIRRSNWISTNWYRSQEYYDAVSWRGSWKEDGGGVLLNQAVHQLDLWQWICGMPQRIYGHIYPNKLRNIEVETEGTIYAEYKNGATGFFTAATTEAMGTNRFEIVGSTGKLVIENEQLHLWKMIQDETFWPHSKDTPSYEEVPIDLINEKDQQHQKVLENFVQAILFDEPLLASATEGIKSLSIINATYLSSWLDKGVDLPLDSQLYFEELTKKSNDACF